MKDITNFTFQGRQYSQIREFKAQPDKRHIGLYSIISPHTATIIGYEVVILRFRPRKAGILDGKVVSFGGGVAYPGNEEFGRFGWYFSELDNAQRKYDELCEEYSE